MKKTLVLGASPNPERYSNKATLRLLEAGYEVFPVGIQAGRIGELDIAIEMPFYEDIDTITLYVGPANQAVYESYIFSLKPKRIIFNPGTENPHLMMAAEEKGIQVVAGCTLVMLSEGHY